MCISDSSTELKSGLKFNRCLYQLITQINNRPMTRDCYDAKEYELCHTNRQTTDKLILISSPNVE